MLLYVEYGKNRYRNMKKKKMLEKKVFFAKVQKWAINVLIEKTYWKMQETNIIAKVVKKTASIMLLIQKF